MSDDEEVTLEGTLALIKPDSVRNENHIREIIENEDFMVIERKKFRFSRSLAEEFYAPHYKQPFFNELIDYMTSGDTVALCLARENGVEHWKKMLGPKKVREAMQFAPNSLRARYGNPDNELHNALHGSDDPESSEREIEIVFPHILQGSEKIQRDLNETLLNLSLSKQPTDHKKYLQKYVCPTLLKGLTEMYETRPDKPVEWLADWLESHNPYKLK